ncbi:MAG: RnfABCDGE type electron transport complex subunit D [Vulcanimicrobiota bacterium]
MPSEKYNVSSSPHIFGKDSVSKIMWTVNICLAPAGLASIYIFGMRAFFIIFLSILGAVGAEYLWQRATHKPITIKDGSAFLTGLLLAYNLPPTVSWWLPLLGSAFAIIIVKQFFGGLGMNIFNPALAARGFLLASWPQEMTTWAKPIMGFSIDLTTSATPLDMLKRSRDSEALIEQFRDNLPNAGAMLKRLVLGFHGGSLGETCALLLLIGAIYLIAKKYIDWQIPAVYIGTVIVLSLVFKFGRGYLDVLETIIFSTFSGGLILGAFYMATDYVTCPATVKGRMIFAAGCGIITFVIRMWGGYPEGVCYSILVMNAFVPLIDDYVKPEVYGAKPKKELKTA